jgi:hypothetical protein
MYEPNTKRRGRSKNTAWQCPRCNGYETTPCDEETIQISEKAQQQDAVEKVMIFVRWCDDCERDYHNEYQLTKQD